MLKLKLSKSDWEKLEPAVQELYEADGDDYVLQVQTDNREDVGPLKRALDRVKADLEAERTARREAESKLDEIDTVDARKRGDIEKLTQQWEKKLSDVSESAQAREAKLRGWIEQHAIDGVVEAITSRNTGSKENAALLDPHVRGKLAVEFSDDGEPQLMMKGDSGPVPLDVEAFEKSVVDNPAYKAIIVENRASGGDASGENPGHGGGAFQTDNQGQQGSGEPDLATVDPSQLVKLLPKT
jgi:hypothetical protein